jgi:hypothetical protein
MINDLIQTGTSSLIPFKNMTSEPSDNFFKFTITGDETTMEVSITGKNFNSIVEQWYFTRYKNTKKENYYVIAVNNLIKKTEFLQLSLQFAQEVITSDEYQQEINNNSDKYLIKFDCPFNKIDMPLIEEILDKVEKKDLTIDEVSDLFSIESNQLHKMLMK